MLLALLLALPRADSKIEDENGLRGVGGWNYICLGIYTHSRKEKLEERREGGKHREGVIETGDYLERATRVDRMRESCGEGTGKKEKDEGGRVGGSDRE